MARSMDGHGFMGRGSLFSLMIGTWREQGWRTGDKVCGKSVEMTHQRGWGV